MEEKFKTSAFWLNIGTINHCIALIVLMTGCVFSGFSCQGDVMQETLTIYTFTLFTPQVAVEIIILLALLLVSGGSNTLRSSFKPAVLFVLTLTVTLLFAMQIA